MDTDNIATAQKVWRFNSGGLGHSNTGVSGPFPIAITQDGQIVADFITTGNLDASLITTGVLNASLITAGNLNANRIYGGTFTVGGADNVNGSISVKNAGGEVVVLIDKDGVTLSNGAKLIGGNGVLSNLKFSGIESGSEATGAKIYSGDYGLLGFAGVLYDGPNAKTRIVFDAYIPTNFTVLEAKITINHFPMQVFNSSGGVAGWGYSRAIKAYKINSSNIYRDYTPYSSYKDTETEYYSEISGAFGASGYTPSVPNASVHNLETTISSDISSQLSPGLNRLKVESSEATPTSTWIDGEANDTTVLNCALRSGMVSATLNVVGYMK
jgi:hypothetical protein